MSVSIEAGTLYVVATPIGNLEDLSPRAVRILSDVDWIAAEDTRHSKNLLRHFGIRTSLVSLHEHNEQARIQRIVTELQNGKAIALISDAGTPLISDPGFRLVRCVREQGLRTIPIPGPSSLTAALSVAGLPTDRFVFEGFLPARANARQRRLEAIRLESRTLVFFEASHRIQASLADMAAILGKGREAVVLRELTKTFEEVQGNTLGEIIDWIAADENRRKGEFVIVVNGAAVKAGKMDDAELRRLLQVLLEDLTLKRAVVVASRISGTNKNDLYDLALTL